jgi:hypothetical protein
VSHDRISNRPFTKRYTVLGESFSSMPRTEARSVKNARLERLDTGHLQEDNELSHKIIRRPMRAIKPSESETEISLNKILAYQKNIKSRENALMKMKKNSSYDEASLSGSDHKSIEHEPSRKLPRLYTTGQYEIEEEDEN